MRTLEKYKLLPNKWRCLIDRSFYSIPTFSISSLLFVFLFSFNQEGFAQNYYGGQFIKKGQPTLRAYEKEGAKAFKKAHYGDAMAYYTNAVKMDSTKIENFYQLGLAAIAFKDNAAAKEAFMMVEKLNDPLAPYANYKDAIFYHSIIEKEEGNEDNATVLKEQLDTTYTIPKYTFNKIQNIDDWDKIGPTCDPALSDAAAQINITSLDGINTIYSETGPFWRKGKLHYTSLRFKKEDDKGANGQKRIYAKTLQSELGKDGSTWMINKYENKDTLMASKYGNQDSLIAMNIPNKTTAHFTFDTTENLMYFTICDYVKKKNSTIQCQIYYRVKTTNGWSEPKKLKEEINVPGYTTTHPAIGVNESGTRTLFYVSDRPGGKGGLDIWQTPILGPNNFGRISPLATNTRDNEITPFYHHKTNTLYFSSQGHNTVKQYDVYKMTNELAAGGWSPLESLPAPINSNADDFGYFLEPNRERGFMVSSRADCNKLVNGDWACHDIFQVDYCLPKLRIEPIDKETDSILTDITVTLSALIGEDTIEQKNESGDDFLFTDLDTSLTYIVKIEKDTYDPVVKAIKLINCDTNDIKIYLEETCQPKLIVKAFARAYYEETGLYGEIVPLNNSTISTSPSLEFINPSRSDYFEFHIDTTINYQISVKNDSRDFLNQEPIIDLKTGSFNYLSNDCEIVKEVLFTYVIRDEKFDAIACYFDHDVPKKITPFDQLINVYSNEGRKKDYLLAFAKNEGKQGVIKNKKAVNDFFTNNVDASFITLEAYKDALLDAIPLLHPDSSYILTIQGYTSDIGDTGYNDDLATRRIQSVWQYFTKTHEADFKKYVDSKKLVLEDEPLGEDTSDPIYKQADGRKYTIYSPASAKKRRVEIIRKTKLTDFSKKQPKSK